jgi:hypothetical protein
MGLALGLAGTGCALLTDADSARSHDQLSLWFVYYIYTQSRKMGWEKSFNFSTPCGWKNKKLERDVVHTKGNPALNLLGIWTVGKW